MKKQELKSGNTNLLRLSKKYLTEVKSKIGSADLDVLIELLESTVDPDPSELYLLQSLYQLKEKLVLTESRLTTYLNQSKVRLPENKLDDLYDGDSSYGTSKLFKY